MSIALVPHILAITCYILSSSEVRQLLRNMRLTHTKQANKARWKIMPHANPPAYGYKYNRVKHIFIYIYKK